MKLLSGRFIRSAVTVLVFGMACGQAIADGELKNGDFVQTWKMGDRVEEQLIPMYWFTSEPETTGKPWVKVLNENQPGVEITAGETSRFIFQDVKLDGSLTWTLKWISKGKGTATVDIYPRDDDGNIFQPVSRKVELTDEPHEEEMDVQMPAQTTILRIMLAPQPPDSIVNFEDIQLTSDLN